MAHEIRNTELSELPQLPGFDLESAMRRLRGRWDRLQPLLLKFTRHYRDANGELRSLIEDAQWEKAQALLHDIKGSGGNIGAVDIANVSAELEIQIKASDRELHPAMLDKFAHCVGQLAEAECVLHAMTDPVEPITAEIKNNSDLNDIENCLRSIEAGLQNDVGQVEEEIDILIAHCRGRDLEDLAMQIQSKFSRLEFSEISRTINQYFDLSA